MKTLYTAILILAGCCLPVRAEIGMKAHWSPVANFAHQTDCLADSSLNCSRDVYATLWKSNFIASDTDRRLFDDWLAMRTRYALGGELDAQRPKAMRMRLAGLKANSVAGYKKQLLSYLLEQDRKTAGEFIDRFYPKFLHWWERDAEPYGKNFIDRFETLFTNPLVQQKLSQFITFYAADLPEDWQLSVTFMYLPQGYGGRGTYADSKSVVEFHPSDTVRETFMTVMHETCHYLYAHAEKEKAASLPRLFAETGSPVYAPAYNLLNEALATILGSGSMARATMNSDEEFQRFISRPLSLYNDQYIDRAAKAALPFVDMWLSKGDMFHEDFAEGYNGAIAREFGDRLPPQLYFNTMLLLQEDYGTPLISPVFNSLHPAFLVSAEVDTYMRYARDILAQHGTKNCILAIRPESVGRLRPNRLLDAESAKLLTRVVKRNKTAVFSYQREPSVYTIIVVADDYAQAAEGITRFAGSKVMPDGLLE